MANTRVYQQVMWSIDRVKKIIFLALLMLITSHSYGADDYVTWGSLDKGGIASTTSDPRKFASLTEGSRIHPNRRGGEIKVNVSIKATNVVGWAGLWIRMDGANGETLGFDNMDNRPITGSTGWVRYSNQLYVPKNATNVVYGVLLEGAGKIEVSDLTWD